LSEAYFWFRDCLNKTLKAMKKIAIVLLSFVLLVGIISCGPSDDKINEAVKTALSGNGALGTVTTTVAEGVVTLRGEVDNDELKALAETTAREVKGVKNVVNSLSVKPKVLHPKS